MQTSEYSIIGKLDAGVFAMRQAIREYKAKVFQALSHVTRVGIVEQLRYGELSTEDLCERLSVEQADASRHLAILENCRIVLTRKEINQVFYRLSDDAMGKMLSLMREFFSTHLDDALDVVRNVREEGLKEAES
jgi:DNA-binding transcriptional ArsR family regulator